jgi:hypothetical protein
LILFFTVHGVVAVAPAPVALGVALGCCSCSFEEDGEVFSAEAGVANLYICVALYFISRLTKRSSCCRY